MALRTLVFAIFKPSRFTSRHIIVDRSYILVTLYACLNTVCHSSSSHSLILPRYTYRHPRKPGKMLRSTLLLIAATSVSALELGCFSDTSETLSNFVNNGSYIFQSIGYCQQVCSTMGHSYFALKGNNCWCGDAIPPISDMVDDSNCDIPCAGFVRQNCMFISVERKVDMLFFCGLY